MKKSRFKEIVKEVLVEDNEYQIFFQKCLSKAGKSIPEMSTQEKKDFFNKIDSAWKGKGEKKNEDLVGNQYKLDKDDDGDIDATDLKKLRSEAISTTKVDAKQIASKMRNSKTMKGFADKVEKMGKVSHTDVENLLPDYVAGKDIANLFESKQSLNEGWFDIIAQGALVLSIIAYAFQLKGYAFNTSGFKKVFKDIKKWWKYLKYDKDLVRIVTTLIRDKEFMDASKQKVTGPRGGHRPQYESDAQFREFLKQKLSSSDYELLKKFQQKHKYHKDPNMGDWLHQRAYTGKKRKFRATDESINEDSKKVWKKDKVLFVDSDFVNSSKGKLPGNGLKHAGYGDFYLDLDGGVITFMRHHEKFDGMSGRSHTVSDDQNGKLLAQLIKKMGAKIVNESINEDVNFKDGKYTFKSRSGVASLLYNGKVLSIGDFDQGADCYFMNHSTFKGQQSFEDGHEVLAHFKKNKITNESINEDKLSDFEKLLKSHDWYYDRSDDHSKWKRGSQQRKDLVDLKTQLGKEGKQKEAESLWSKYKKG